MHSRMDKDKARGVVRIDESFAVSIRDRNLSRLGVQMKEVNLDKEL